MEHLLLYAFNNLGLDRITANIPAQNKDAQKSLGKSGFILEGKEK